MRIAIYSRKSKWTGKGDSVENQLVMCREYIQAMIPESKTAEIHEYEDEGFSGKNTNRPQFQKMMEDIRKEHFDFLVCYKLDRLGRNISDLALLIDEMNKKNITFISIKERFDTSTPIGKAMLYFSGVLAQMEREQIAERVRDNMLMLARSGRWLGGTTPLGFTSKKNEKVTIENKVRTSYSLSVNEKEIHMVQFLFQKFLKEQSLTKLNSYLLEHGYKTRLGKHYQVTTIRDILCNPVYCTADKESCDYFVDLGCHVCLEGNELNGTYGLISYAKTSSGNYKNKENPVQDWIIAAGRHPGTIPSKDWIKVQKLLEINKKKGEHFRKVQNPYSVLSGLLYCKCGAPMRPKNYPESRLHTDGTRSFAYLCSCKEKSHGKLCNVANVHGNILDEVVIQEVLKYLDPDSQVNQLLKELQNRIVKDHKTEVTEYDLMNQQLTEKKNQIKNLIDSLSHSAHNQTLFDYVNTQVNQLDEECRELQEKFRGKETPTKLNGDMSFEFEVIMEQLKNFKTFYKDLSVLEKRELLRMIIDKVIWDGENAHIFILGSH